MKLLWIVGVIVSIVLGCIAFMFADNQPPYSYIVEKSYVIPNPSHAGHQVLIHWEFKINRLCPGTIVRTIVDAKTGATISYDPTPALSTVKIGDTFLERTFFLPEGIRPGPKLYRANAEYVCNPLHRVWPLKVQTPDIPFEVTTN
jgi:hypothetical protein